MRNARLHIISEESQEIVRKVTVGHIPEPGDEIRLGLPGNERYYQVTRRVWALDEVSQDDRVNIGVTEVNMKLNRITVLADPIEKIAELTGTKVADIIDALSGLCFDEEQAEDLKFYATGLDEE